jgi:hypothetical protein
VEPDGNVRTVEYSADPLRGFNAVVKKSGPTVHSVAVPVVEPHVAVAPVVHAPVAPVTHVEHVAPIAHVEHVAPISHMDHVAPIAHFEHVAPIAPVAPLTHFGPIVAAPAPVAEVVHDVAHIAPIAPLAHAPLVAPIVETPIIPYPYDFHLPILPVPDHGPLVSVTGTTYGSKGHILRRWTAGPISLDGNKITIRTKH